MAGQLPPGWEARWNQSYGRYYFVNHATQTTTWNDPRINQSRPAEQIPLQDFTPRQASTSAQWSSTARTKETGFQAAIDSRNDEDNEDEEWRNALLMSQMQSDQRKHLPFHEKVNMKEKFKREFKELDSYVVESTIEKHHYDEDMARATLASLKDEKQRKKRAEEERKRREKEQDEERKTKELRERMNKMKKELKEKNELKEKKEAERRRADLQAERQRSAAAANQRAFTTVDIRKLSEQKKTTTTVKSAKQPREKVAKETTKKDPAKRAPAKRDTLQASQSPRPTGREPVYVSPNRLQPAGPQASLRQGPDRSHLVRQYSSASGPNKALVSGPQRTNRAGASAIQQKMSLSKGPQASLRQGPQQCRNQETSLLAGEHSRFAGEHSRFAGEHSRFVSAV